ncbi:PaaI family thioesterase [Ruminococcus sp.]|uniref:PaaI family thioesterase n=1 Tax=Ruminococcus sp. TaxID=41978 RepID=UPI00262D4354|nr:PaaI family thioesterase [Ruminococcus sp.]MDD7556292.1 PaaI family thioesterase [Ruminococcus sp.]MDY4964556.1 PaaI family thioesterase [Ruminococcus callidus]
MEEKTLAQVQEMFENDRFATLNGARITEIGDHYARCEMELDDRHKNALGAVMGGASFTLADFTFAVASNWQKPGTVSLSTNITYLGGAKGSRLIAEAHMVKDGRTTCYYRVDVTDDLGTQVAAVTVTGYHK